MAAAGVTVDGLDALVWALAAVVGMLAYLALCERGPRVPGPSWFDLPMPSRSKEQPMPWWTNYSPSKRASKKASGRAQQTATPPAPQPPMSAACQWSASRARRAALYALITGDWSSFRRYRAMHRSIRRIERLVRA